MSLWPEAAAILLDSMSSSASARNTCQLSRTGLSSGKCDIDTKGVVGALEKSTINAFKGANKAEWSKKTFFQGARTAPRYWKKSIALNQQEMRIHFNGLSLGNSYHHTNYTLGN